MFKNKKILVTGADGFIGSHLVEYLLSQNANIKAFTYYNSFNNWGWLDNLPKDKLNSIEIFQGDIRDPNGVRDAVKGCDVILHLAALIAIPYSYHSPDTYIDTNIKGTLNILQAARDYNIEKIVHTSTSEVYGTAQYVPIDEHHPLQGQSPYSASKIGADQMALSFYRSFDLPVTILRPFNTYGPRQSARAVIPTIISQIASGKKEIKLGSITPTRDFTYVTDTAKAFTQIAASNDSNGKVINCGSDFEISIGDMVKVIAEIMGKKIDIITDKKRIRPEKSEVERLWANTDLAKKTFAWSPEFSGLDGFKKGIENTINWFSNPENLKFYKTDIYNI